MEVAGFLGPCGKSQLQGLQTALNSMNCESLHLEEGVPGDTTNRSSSVVIPSSTKRNPKGPCGKLPPGFLLFVDMLSQTAHSNWNTWSFFFELIFLWFLKIQSCNFFFQSNFGTKLLLKKKRFFSVLLWWIDTTAPLLATSYQVALCNQKICNQILLNSSTSLVTAPFSHYVISACTNTI